jgi:hypothetical protein
MGGDDWFHRKTSQAVRRVPFLFTSHHDPKEVSMKSKTVWNRSTMLTQIMIGLVLLASAATAVAQSNSTPASGTEGNGRCSNRTLSGDYGFALDGTFLPNTPVRGVVMQHYDGRGNITQVDHLVVYGTPPPQEWTPGTGTYTVNSDCTGAATLTTPDGTIYLHFVVVNNGKQINQVVDSNAVTAVGIKVN